MHRMIDLLDETAGEQVAIMVQFAGVEARGTRNARRTKNLHDFDFRMLPCPGGELLVQGLAIRPAQAVALEALIDQQVGAVTGRAERVPMPCRDRHDVDPVIGSKGFAGIEVDRRPSAGTAPALAGRPSPVGAQSDPRAHVVRHCFLHRDLDPLAFSGTQPLHIGRENRHRHLHARARVSRGRTRDQRRPIRFAGHGERTRRSLRDHVVALEIRIWPGCAEPLDARVYQGRMHSLQGLVFEIETLHHARDRSSRRTRRTWAANSSEGPGPQVCGDSAWRCACSHSSCRSTPSTSCSGCVPQRVRDLRDPVPPLSRHPRRARRELACKKSPLRIASGRGFAFHRVRACRSLSVSVETIYSGDASSASAVERGKRNASKAVRSVLGSSSATTSLIGHANVSSWLSEKFLARSDVLLTGKEPCGTRGISPLVCRSSSFRWWPELVYMSCSPHARFLRRLWRGRHRPCNGHGGSNYCSPTPAFLNRTIRTGLGKHGDAHAMPPPPTPEPEPSISKASVEQEPVGLHGGP